MFTAMVRLLTVALALSACNGATSVDAGPGAQDASTVEDAAPAIDGSVAIDAGNVRPAHCPDAATDPLQDVTGTPASPYFVHHPTAPGADVATVMFFPGGPGTRNIGMIVWDRWLSGSTRADDMRVIVPYSASDWPAESERALAIIDEVVECWGGDATRVHLGGTSLGGLAAFDLMLTHGDRFVTVLGAPGLFTEGTTESRIAALQDHAVFLGIGENDSDPWPNGVQSLHDTLDGAGIDSRHEVFMGQGHILDAAFDETIFCEFWATH